MKALEIIEEYKKDILNYKKRGFRKIQIDKGIVTIEDYSQDIELKKYSSWGEDKNGVKVQFSEGYKRIS